MAIEFELKYRATPEILDRIRRSCSAEFAVIPMTTTYYDAPDGSLSARHWTVRHRQEGEKQVCTLKTPAGGGARGEWEVECGDIFQALDSLEALGGVTLPRDLRATCGARFTRQAALLAGEGFTAELALDSGSLLGGEKSEDLCEVELELKSGDREAMAAFAEGFACRYGLTSEPKSKYARARALAGEG